MWQRAILSSAVLVYPQSLLLSFGLLCPGKGHRRGEKEPGLQAPVCWVLCAYWRSD